MAILSTRVFSDSNKLQYDKLAVTMAISPRFDTQLEMSVAVRLIPYRDGDEGPESCEEGTQTVVFGNALQAAQKDQDLAVCIAKIEEALQQFVIAKSL
jgi:hypothetical protein